MRGLGYSLRKITDKVGGASRVDCTCTTVSNVIGIIIGIVYFKASTYKNGLRREEFCLSPNLQYFTFNALPSDILEIEVRDKFSATRPSISHFLGKVKIPLLQFLRWQGDTYVATVCPQIQVLSLFRICRERSPEQTPRNGNVTYDLMIT